MKDISDRLSCSSVPTAKDWEEVSGYKEYLDAYNETGRHTSHKISALHLYGGTSEYKIKALLATFEVSKPVDSSITSMFSVSSSYSIKPFVSVKIPDPGAAEDVNKCVPEFIHDLKSGNLFELKLGPVEYEHYSKFVLPKEFDELSYCEIAQVMNEVFDQNSPHCNTRFNYFKLVIEHDEDLYNYAGVVNFHYDKSSFGILVEK
ncbi:hypothetical protein ACTXT7_003124 [Hymenolepis weldensis]